MLFSGLHYHGAGAARLSAVRAARDAVRTVRKIDYSQTRVSRRRAPGDAPRPDVRSSLRVAIAIQQPDGQAVATLHAQHRIRAGSRYQPIASRPKPSDARTIRELKCGLEPRKLLHSLRNIRWALTAVLSDAG